MTDETEPIRVTETNERKIKIDVPESTSLGEVEEVVNASLRVHQDEPLFDTPGDEVSIKIRTEGHRLPGK